MANTPITAMRLDDETKNKLAALSQQRGATMTDTVRSLIKEAKMEQPVFTIETVDEHEIAVLTYRDGTKFTTIDWQGRQPASIEEVQDYRWMEMETMADAIMIDGFPRLLI